MALTPWQTAARAHRAPFYTMDGETVAYARGENSVGLTAIKLDQGVMADDVEGVKALVWDLAFMVKAADLVFGSNAVTPQRGDTITDAAGVVYDVQGDPRQLEDSDEWQIPVQKVAQ